jgi:DNA-binding NtrC family response regulator
MAETLEECLARAAACRAAAASEALENVRQVHLEAAASWEVLAGRTQWVPNPGERQACRRPDSADDALALSCASSRQLNISRFKAEPLSADASAAINLPAANGGRQLAIELDTHDNSTTTKAGAEPCDSQEICKVMLYTVDGHMRTLRDIEADVISLAIELYRGRMAEVARRLGIGRSTLYRKMAELGIDDIS